MKQVLVVAVILLWQSVAWAITPEQLREADATLRQMDSKISVLRGYVQRAERGTVEGITLTTAQKQGLKDAYVAEKADLATLYSTLP